MNYQYTLLYCFTLLCIPQQLLCEASDTKALIEEAKKISKLYTSSNDIQKNAAEQNCRKRFVTVAENAKNELDEFQKTVKKASKNMDKRNAAYQELKNAVAQLEKELSPLLQPNKLPDTCIEHIQENINLDDLAKFIAAWRFTFEGSLTTTLAEITGDLQSLKARIS